jgi:branched-chain amino acid transport system permease protein
MSKLPGSFGRRPFTWKLWAGLAGLLFLLAIPLLRLAGGYLQTLGFLTFLYVTMSTAWNILGGYTGQTSFGHATFYGLGAYTTMILALRGVPPLLTLPLAGIVAAVYGLLWGYPCLRLRGQYFAIATIGVGEATRLLMLNLDDLLKNSALFEGLLRKGVLTGGATGLMLPTPPDIRAYATAFYYGGLALMFLALAISWWVRKSKFGLGLFAINMDIDAAETVGVPTTRYKILALLLSAFMVGMAGSIYAQYVFYIDPQTVFGFPVSIAMVLMPTIGGIGTLVGPILGAVVYVVVQDRILTANLTLGALKLSLSTMHLLVYGGLLVLIVLFEPKGLIGLFRRFARWWERRRPRLAALRDRNQSEVGHGRTP